MPNGNPVFVPTPSSNALPVIAEPENKDYDKEPVVACIYCNSLHIEYDELDNNVCMRCGSVNELKEFKNIYEYKEYLNGKK
jgi:DNA-directed RNA polymerase subunit RPC12/RpoP